MYFFAIQNTATQQPNWLKDTTAIYADTIPN